MTAKLRTSIALLALLLCGPLPAEDKVRTWTDVDGKAMEAQFLREIDGDVTFLKDGKLTTIPLDRLCEKDRELIPQLAAALELEAASTPSSPPPPANLPTGDSAAPPSAASSASDPKPNLTAKRPAAETRTWRDLRGTEVTGSFVRMNGRNVVLMRGGRVVTFSYFFLSRSDRDYLTNYLTTLGQESQIPVSTPENDPLLQPPPEPSFQPPPAFAGGPQMPPPPGMNGGDSPLAAARAAAEEQTQQLMAAQQEQMRIQSEQQQQVVAANSEIMRQNAETHSQYANAAMRSVQSRMDAYNNRISGECSNCKKEITQDQSSGKTCPHCGVNWQYKEDQFGHKTAIPGALPPSDSGEFRIGGLSERNTYKLIFRIIIPAVIAIAAGLYRVLR
jgi:hypothetical protein